MDGVVSLQILSESLMDPKQIFSESIRHFLTPVVPLLDDEDISEIMINGFNRVYYEKAGKLFFAENTSFTSERALLAAAANIAQYCNRRIGDEYHSMEARLPDGSRVHIVIPPSSRVGVCVSIRKFKKASFNLQTLVQWGSLTSEVAEFLKIAVLLHKNIIISGGTGSGKTSLLNALSAEIPEDERIIVIEDSSELQLHQPHTIYMEAQQPKPGGLGQVTIRDLFVDSLRMRPDRIVVGEVRRGEALDLIQSMISGHDGSLTTVHASTPRDAAIRLETLSLMSDVSLPIYVARAQVASAIHLVVQIARFSDGTRKITAISECRGLSKERNYRFKKIYSFVREEVNEAGKILGCLKRTGKIPSFSQAPFANGLEGIVHETLGIFQKETPRNISYNSHSR